MRTDVFIKQVLARCDALKSAGLWPAEPRIRPRAWLNNFEEADQPLAAMLLDRFNYYNESMSDRLLAASYDSLGDGIKKGPDAPPRHELLTALPDAVFSPVEGEEPNRTDSGNLLCRKARQVLRVPAERIVGPEAALEKAAAGTPVVFLDDFIGSGDQFVVTWQATRAARQPFSFADAFQSRAFVAIYVTLVATDYGLAQINSQAPNVAVSSAHILDKTSTVRELKPGPANPDPNLPAKIKGLLQKYALRLTPAEKYISEDADYRAFGYKKRGLLFAFSHSVPDATLPLFWSPGTNGWTPLLERT